MLILQPLFSIQACFKNGTNLLAEIDPRYLQIYHFQKLIIKFRNNPLLLAIKPYLCEGRRMGNTSLNINQILFLDFSIIVITHQIKLEWQQYLTYQPQNEHLKTTTVKFLGKISNILDKKFVF